MALFGKKKKDEEKKEPKEAVESSVGTEKEAAPSVFSMPENDDAKSYQSILHPHVTEKATLMNSQNKYTFKVAKSSNKIEIRRAIEKLYKVKVIKVTIVNIPSKTKRIGRNEGQRGGLKKAIITLKQGDKIETNA
jgi:large subunit ribosomal protein L23